MTKTYHPYSSFRVLKSEDLNDGDKLEMCMSHIVHSSSFCRRLKTKAGKGPFHECWCLEILKDEKDEDGNIVNSREDEREAVASYMTFFYKKPKEERQQIVMDWIRYTEDKNDHRKYHLPFINVNYEDESIVSDDDDDGNTPLLAALKSHRVCKAALAHLLDVRSVQWRTCQNAVRNNTIPTRGNKFRRAGKGKAFDDHVRGDLHVFLEEELKMLWF